MPAPEVLGVAAGDQEESDGESGRGVQTEDAEPRPGIEAACLSVQGVAPRLERGSASG